MQGDLSSFDDIPYACKIDSILRQHYYEGVFPQKEGINMRFSRKLLVRKGTQSGTYGSLSVPKPVLDAWASVENVEIQFDERNNILVIKPIASDKV